MPSLPKPLLPRRETARVSSEKQKRAGPVRLLRAWTGPLVFVSREYSASPPATSVSHLLPILPMPSQSTRTLHLSTSTAFQASPYPFWLSIPPVTALFWVRWLRSRLISVPLFCFCSCQRQYHVPRGTQVINVSKVLHVLRVWHDSCCLPTPPPCFSRNPVSPRRVC